MHWIRVWVAFGAALATRQSFSRLSQIDRLIVRLIIFKICRFSNAPFLNLGVTGFRSKWRAGAPQREHSEGCFSEPRLLASRPLCPNSISVLFYLKRVLTTVYCQMLAFGTTFLHLILIEFKEHFKLVVFLGIRTRTSGLLDQTVTAAARIP